MSSSAQACYGQPRVALPSPESPALLPRKRQTHLPRLRHLVQESRTAGLGLGSVPLCLLVSLLLGAPVLPCPLGARSLRACPRPSRLWLPAASVTPFLSYWGKRLLATLHSLKHLARAAAHVPASEGRSQSLWNGQHCFSGERRALGRFPRCLGLPGHMPLAQIPPHPRLSNESDLTRFPPGKSSLTMTGNAFYLNCRSQLCFIPKLCRKQRLLSRAQQRSKTQSRVSHLSEDTIRSALCV